MICRLTCLAVFTLASACSEGARETAVDVSIIGPRPAVVNPDRSVVLPGSEALLATTAQGLVRLDEQGRIVPGLAERWIVTDDGLSLIFRINRAKWTDGRDVGSAEVADDIRRLVSSANPLSPYANGVEKVSGMTGRVIEIRFASPQPQFLELLAQPEAAVMRRTIGTGPLRLVSSKGGVYRLRQPSGEGEAAEDAVTLRGDDAARAIARFRQDSVHLVGNGTFADLPLARAANPSGAELRFDPVNGLFGFVVSGKSNALKSAEVRAALAMALDRERLLKLFNAPGWRQAVSIVPAQLDLPAAPAAQDWVPLGIDDRVTRASGLVASWRAKHGSMPVLRVAVPRGPGGRLLFAAVRADWARIGVKIALASGPDADLRLVDEVSPQTSASWYLGRLSCARGNPCSEKGEAALNTARHAPDLVERAKKLGEADSAFALNTPFIPIASPLRWSLVSNELAGWRENAFAAHPLDKLRAIAR